MILKQLMVKYNMKKLIYISVIMFIVCLILACTYVNFKTGKGFSLLTNTTFKGTLEKDSETSYKINVELQRDTKGGSDVLIKALDKIPNYTQVK